MNGGAEKRKTGAEKRKTGAEKRKTGVRRREKQGAEKRTCTLGPLYITPVVYPSLIRPCKKYRVRCLVCVLRMPLNNVFTLVHILEPPPLADLRRNRCPHPTFNISGSILKILCIAEVHT